MGNRVLPEAKKVHAVEGDLRAGYAPTFSTVGLVGRIQVIASATKLTLHFNCWIYLKEPECLAPAISKTKFHQE